MCLLFLKICSVSRYSIAFVTLPLLKKKTYPISAYDGSLLCSLTGYFDGSEGIIGVESDVILTSRAKITPVSPDDEWIFMNDSGSSSALSLGGNASSTYRDRSDRRASSMATWSPSYGSGTTSGSSSTTSSSSAAMATAARDDLVLPVGGDFGRLPNWSGGHRGRPSPGLLYDMRGVFQVGDRRGVGCFYFHCKGRWERIEYYRCAKAREENCRAGLKYVDGQLTRNRYPHSHLPSQLPSSSSSAAGNGSLYNSIGMV